MARHVFSQRHVSQVARLQGFLRGSAVIPPPVSGVASPVDKHDELLKSLPNLLGSEAFEEASAADEHQDWLDWYHALNTPSLSLSADDDADMNGASETLHVPDPYERGHWENWWVQNRLHAAG